MPERVVSNVLADRVAHAGCALWCKLPPVVDVSALRTLLLIVTGWLDRREREMLAY